MTTFADWATGGEATIWLREGKIRHFVARARCRFWLKAPYYVKDEVWWATGETRKAPTTFYDGAIDHKRLKYAS